MRAFLLSVLGLMLYAPIRAQTKRIEPSCSSVFTMHKDGGAQAIRYESSHRLDKPDTAIRTLLVYIHGINRNGLAYFGYADDMVRSAGHRKETLVIAPQYADAEDLDYYRLGNEFLYWKKAEWKDGHTSMSGSMDKPALPFYCDGPFLLYVSRRPTARR